MRWVFIVSGAVLGLIAVTISSVRFYSDAGACACTGLGGLGVALVGIAYFRYPAPLMRPAGYPGQFYAPPSMMERHEFWAGVFIVMISLPVAAAGGGGFLCLGALVAFITGVGLMFLAWSRVDKFRGPTPVYSAMPTAGQPTQQGYMVPVLYRPSPYHQTLYVYPNELQLQVSGGRQTGKIDVGAGQKFCGSCGAPMLGDRCGYCGRSKEPRPEPTA